MSGTVRPHQMKGYCKFLKLLLGYRIVKYYYGIIKRLWKINLDPSTTSKVTTKHENLFLNQFIAQT